MFAWMSAWFLTAHLIESTIIPLQIIFEHRMYLPSIGLAFGSVILFYDLLSKRLPRPRLQAALLVSAIFLFGLATYASNMDLRNDVSLYRDELGRYPNSKRIRLCLATALTRSGSFAEAGKLLEALVLEHPDDIQVLQNWHNFLSNVPGDAEAADLVYQHIVQLMNRDRHMSRFDVEAVWSLANFFFRSNDFQDASFLMNHILIDFKYNHLWFLKGRCHAALGEWDLALGAFHRAWEEKPKDPSTLYWYGKSLIKVGEHDKGCKMLELIAQSPINVDATRMGRELLEEDCERGLEQF